MTARHDEHEGAVTAWLHRAARGSRVQIIEAFEHAFTVLWQRSHITLGDATLAVIIERVLHCASEKCPSVVAIVVTESEPGIRCDGLRAVMTGLHEDQVCAVLSFVLVEFLTVLGNLTAEILTPALHDELSKCTSPAKRCGVTRENAR